MRHRTHYKSFGRDQGAKKALVRGLVNSLVEHERVRTTLTKAKYIRSYVEKAITLGKKSTVHAHRVLASNYPNQDTCTKIMKDLAPRFKDRPGGYTRVVKLAARPGDQVDMAFIEFVDYKLPEVADETVTGDAAEAKQAKAQAKVHAKRKKHIRQVQNKSRNNNR